MLNGMLDSAIAREGDSDDPRVAPSTAFPQQWMIS